MEAQTARATRTKVVRVLAADLERLTRLSGLDERFSLAAKVQALLNWVEQRRDLEDLRAVVREELQRMGGEA